MKFVFVQGDLQETNSSNWLLHIPTQALRKAGHEAQVVDRSFFTLAVNGTGDDKLLREADVIIAERVAFGNMKRAIAWWASRKPVIYRFDDHYKAMPDYAIAHAYWQKNVYNEKEGKPVYAATPMLRQLEETVHYASAISAPSRFLLSEYGKDLPASRKVFIPNRHDPSHPMWATPKLLEHPGEIWLGWGGSHNHAESWTGSGILPALKSVLKRHPTVRLAIAGLPVKVLQAIQQAGLPAEQVVPVPWLPFNLWPGALKMFDVGLAPLAGEYDKGRSWIKALEYSQLGIPWIGSAHGNIYAGSEGGMMVVNTPDAWERAIENRIRESCGNPKAIQWAEGEAIEYHLDEYERLRNL